MIFKNQIERLLFMMMKLFCKSELQINSHVFPPLIFKHIIKNKYAPQALMYKNC